MTLDEAIASVSSKVRRFKKKMGELDGRVPVEFAKELIRASAWWFDHPDGPVRAPEHCERIELDDDCEVYVIRFGGNLFDIGKAICGCVSDIEDAVLASQKSRKRPDRADLHRNLLVSITFAVCVFGRRGPHGCYPTDSNGFMHFGTQAICVPDWIEYVSDYFGVELLCSAGSS